jgi:HprK-related kinase A
VRPADDLFLLYHRPSGETHVLAADALAILQAIDGAPGDAAAVLARLTAGHELQVEAGDAEAIVAARLAENGGARARRPGRLMLSRWRERVVRCGPFGFLLRSPVGAVIEAVEALYRDYPADAEDGIVDYTVAVAPPHPVRRWIRPRLDLRCDIEIPDMAPQPVAHGLLALEMGMNLQIAVGMHRFLLLHAGAAARGDGAVLVTGDSGAGKSTLAALLGWSGWRFLGDEFALVDPAGGALLPFPRPASLKNESIPLLEARAPDGVFGPVFDGTIKGRIRHLAPPAAALAAMDRPAAPRLILTPAFEAGAPSEARRLGVAETFVLLTQASTNYRSLGEAGFDALARLADVPAYAVRYGSADAALALVEELWAAHG